MVTDVTSLTGNGLKDWLVQRATAVYFAAYCIVLFIYLLVQPSLDYVAWHALFHNNWFKVASIMAVFAICLHAWVGIWTVSTDYIKCTVIRLGVQMAIVAWLSALLVWGIMILWGQ